MKSQGAAVVEGHSGHTYAQRPRAFAWQGERLEVEEVISSSHSPEGKRFRVRASGRRFDLLYDPGEDSWTIEEV